MCPACAGRGGHIVGLQLAPERAPTHREPLHPWTNSPQGAQGHPGPPESPVNMGTQPNWEGS